MSYLFCQRIARILLPIALALSLAACKTLERNEAIHTERLLAAAGFQMRQADTPSRVQELASLPKRKLVPTRSGGALHYVYADDLGCKCIYVGSEKAYQRYAFDERYVGADVTNPRFDKYAEIFGGAGFYVERPEDIGNALQEALNCGKPSIIEIPTDPDEMPRPARLAEVQAPQG